MTNEELIFAEYKLYSESKEKFIDRSFTTNKFYMIIVIALLALSFEAKDVSFGMVSAPVMFTAIGMLSSALWWLNIDSYNSLIKIKFSKVLEEIEKQLPIQPYAMEYKALKDYRASKKGFIFGDVQNVFAVISFLIFFSLFLIGLMPHWIIYLP